MTDQPRGCLAFLFGFGTKSDLSASSEGNVHSGPGGYEDGSYVGGYAAEYLAEQDYFDEGEEH